MAGGGHGQLPRDVRVHRLHGMSVAPGDVGPSPLAGGADHAVPRPAVV